jgi:hypothetical protein
MPSLIELLAALLLFATVPVSAQMLARAALHLHPRLAPPPPRVPAGTGSDGREVGNSPAGADL